MVLCDPKPPLNPLRTGRSTLVLSDTRTASLERFGSDLLNNATSEACAASTEEGWMICVVVTSGMNHQRATLYIGHFEPGRQYWIICVAHGVYE